MFFFSSTSCPSHKNSNVFRLGGFLQFSDTNWVRFYSEIPYFFFLCRSSPSFSFSFRFVRICHCVRHIRSPITVFFSSSSSSSLFFLFLFPNLNIVSTYMQKCVCVCVSAHAQNEIPMHTFWWCNRVQRTNANIHERILLNAVRCSNGSITFDAKLKTWNEISARMPRMQTICAHVTADSGQGTGGGERNCEQMTTTTNTIHNAYALYIERQQMN